MWMPCTIYLRARRALSMQTEFGLSKTPWYVLILISSLFFRCMLSLAQRRCAFRCTKLLQARRAYIANTLRGKNGLHAFGNNSAESEPIWIKSGMVWAKCGGWPWQIVGAIPHPSRSDSLTGIVFQKKQNFKVLRLQAALTPQWLQMPKTRVQMVPILDV